MIKKCRTCDHILWWKLQYKKNTGKIYCDYFILDGRIEIQAAEKRTFTDIM